MAATTKKSRRVKKTAAPAVRATLAMFDTRFHEGRSENYREKFAGVELSKLKPLTIDDYHPSGGTPLIDATVQMIGSLHRAYSESPNDVHIGFLLDESGSMGSLRESVVVG